MNVLMNTQVPSFFIRKLTTQVFSFINISLFNRYHDLTNVFFLILVLFSFAKIKLMIVFGLKNASLLLRRECCTFSNGEYVKSGLAELEKWIVNAKEEVLRQSFLLCILPSRC